MEGERVRADGETVVLALPIVGNTSAVIDACSPLFVKRGVVGAGVVGRRWEMEE